MKLPLVCALCFVLSHFTGSNGYTLTGREEENSNVAGETDVDMVQVMETLLNTMETDEESWTENEMEYEDVLRTADYSSNAVVQYPDIEEGDFPPMTATTMQAGHCDCIATIYDKPRYKGRSLKVVQQNAEFKNDFFNDRVESIQIKGPCPWIFYEHGNFNGSPRLLQGNYYASAPTWGGKGNRISSARALPPPGTRAICLFQHSNYQGRMLVLYNSHTDLRQIDFNDHITSVIVIGGMWKVYEHPRFSGKSTRLNEGEYPSIKKLRIGGDRISSVKMLD